MTQHNELTPYAEYPDWLSEWEKLAINLASLRRTFEIMSARTRELHELFDEVQFNLADTRALKIKLNSTAKKYGRSLFMTEHREL